MSKRFTNGPGGLFDQAADGAGGSVNFTISGAPVLPGSIMLRYNVDQQPETDSRGQG